jgi:type IV secretory pathway VirJ component
VIALGALIATGVLTKEMATLKNPTATTAAEVKKTVAEVGKVLVLPTDETPTLATVADPSKLAGQPFFANALTGDVVLIYSTSKKAILWRPSTKQVVEVSALNPGVSTTGK